MVRGAFITLFRRNFTVLKRALSPRALSILALGYLLPMGLFSLGSSRLLAKMFAGTKTRGQAHGAFEWTYGFRATDGENF